MPLSATAHQEGGVYASENFIQRQRDGDVVALGARCKDVRRSLTNFAEGHFHNTVGQLRKDFVEGDRDGQLAYRLHADFRAQFAGQTIENRLERNSDASDATGSSSIR